MARACAVPDLPPTFDMSKREQTNALGNSEAWWGRLKTWSSVRKELIIEKKVIDNPLFYASSVSRVRSAFVVLQSLGVSVSSVLRAWDILRVDCPPGSL